LPAPTAPTRDDLRRLAAKLGLAFVTLDPARAGEPDFVAINPLAAGLLPAAECRRRRLMPIALRGGVVTVATPDPFADPGPLFGRPVRVVATTGEDLDAVLGSDQPAAAPAPAGGLLGERLVARGAVAPSEVDAALAEQARTGGRIGELLTAAGAGEAVVAEELAAQLGMPYADADVLAPDERTVGLLPEPLARRLRVVPLAVRGSRLDVAAAEPIGHRDVARITEATGLEPAIHLAAPRALEALLRRAHAAEHAALARAGLLARFPEESASEVLDPVQRRLLVALALVVGVGLLLYPAVTATIAVAALAVFTLAATAWRLVLGFASLARPVAPPPALGRDDHELPVYTVLVPLLREAAVLGRLLAALEALDYPRHKLDVRLLVEADDDETLEAARRAELAPHMTLVEVPPGGPRTKPRALAYGLLLARGDLVTVYDAEDRPPADQLRRAVAAFAAADPRVVCLQARLACFNAGQNLLTRWFAADYAVQFDLLVPELARQGAAIPLGGTSNHLRRSALTELGGWDPFNVTEDADLGVRLHEAGWRTEVLESTTLEEANPVLRNWVGQRSRWAKGHAQTCLVHLRHPVRLARRLGVRGSLAFVLGLGGGVVLPLAQPLFWLLTTVYFLGQAEWVHSLFPSAIFHLATIALFVGNSGAILLQVGGALERGMFDGVRAALFAPLAWALVALASWRGVLQLATRPHHWEKTEHGLDEPA
jgi:cellulose synthase/poly-beta-1,6-N-acetylglucosamine synthase-like glycosyltransferase